MLIEFRVENFRSLRDEQALTFEASSLGDADDPRPYAVKGHAEKLLPAAVVYGGNASGKSNLINAIAFMRSAVVDSQRRWDPEGGVPRTAFAWGGKRKEPSTFEVTFLLKGTKYQYGFVVDDETVLEEWLSAWPKGREQLWFERERDLFTFGDHLKGQNESIKGLTRPNSLFLSAAAQQGHEHLRPLYTWFRMIFPVNVQRSYRRPPWGILPEFLFLHGDDTPTNSSKDELQGFYIEHIQKLLKIADIGIFDIKTVEVDFGMGDRKFTRQRVLFQHNAEDEDSWLDLDEESEGTKTLFRMAPSIFQVLNSGGLLVVDELEASLHPLLGLAIVGLFNSPKTNPHHAQILFTTHDTNLLGNILCEPLLRRDQIWFTEKDKEGATRLYPLTDYRPRKSENLERGYLQGRYGAIPCLGDLKWMKE